MKYLEIMHYFLGMEVWKNVNEIFLVCSGDFEEIQNTRMQGHDNTYGIEPEAIE